MDKIETLAEIAAHSTASISMSPDLMVTFNVGGHTFLVSKETLSRHTGQFTSTYLTALSDPYWNSSTIVPIDRNPVLFEAVLEFLRYDRWRIPKGVPASDVFDELEFYGYVVPRCTVTAAWHRTKKNQEKIILKLQTLEPSVLKQVQDLVAQVLENDSDQLFVAPSADYLERQLAHLGLPSLKVKIADLLRTTLEGALVHNQLFELLRSAEGPQLVTYIAHRQFFESVVEVEQWRLNLEVVTRPGSVANDYRLAATAPSGSDLNRGTGASVLLVRTKPADRNYANQ